MKHVAFVMALLLFAMGAVGIVVPSGLVWVGQHSVTSVAFYFIAVLRVLFGVALLSAAPVSRAPRTIRLLGYFLVLAGLATALTGLVAMDRARAIIEAWVQPGSGLVRLAGVFIAAFGGLIAYACAPPRRAP